jgi:predicted phage terminase large subunit-like protein
MEFKTEATPNEAALELLRRKRGRESLIGFTEYTLPNYSADPFHKLVAEKLEAVERGEIKRLMIFAPPQHGKSELSTRRFPAWYLARNPNKSIISASYNGDFAQTFGRDVRDIILDKSFRRLFPKVSVRDDNRSASEWQLDNGEAGQGGKYYAVGISTATTGKGAHLFLIDDPIKDQKDADSQSKREDQWNWYRSVAFTRLQEGASIVMTLTRWHYDDIAGRALELMAMGKGQPWEVLVLPALPDPKKDEHGIPILNEDGTVPGDPLNRRLNEPLAPSRYSLATLLERRDVSAERTWSAMYQQKPMADEGGMFKTGWIQDHSGLLPAKRTRVRAWDLGATIDGDWTVGVLMSKCTEGFFWIEDVIRFRGTPLDVEKKIMATAANDGRSVAIHLPQDPGQAGVAQMSNLTRKLAGYRVKKQRPTGSKTVRAEPFAAQCENGNVRIAGHGHWRQIFLDELSTFPLGVHDDQVDAASDAFNALLGPKRAVVRDW